MPNSKRYYAQAHGKGGFDIDEDNLNPNARLWRMYALGEYRKIQRLVGELEAVALIWETTMNNKKTTWKQRYLQAEEQYKKLKEEIQSKGKPNEE